ncbi:hypothetical protein [Maridesulfovibrio bastinii]|uniref:hypothetical protein n=1 Tax=Maridesulfovibrio bastinii TaxID=47157 RepID=UPI0004121C66|nr:hypothetical protein [Maridesulfovibrio bastinii]
MSDSAFKKIIFFMIGITCFAVLGTLIFKAYSNYEPAVALSAKFSFQKGLTGETLGLTDSEKRSLNYCLQKKRNVIAKAVLTVMIADPNGHKGIRPDSNLEYRMQLTGTHGIELNIKDRYCYRSDFVSKLVSSLENGGKVLSKYQEMSGIHDHNLKIIDL